MEKAGYSINTEAYSIIKESDDWYSNRVIEKFHKRKNLNGVDYEINRTNFAKRCCADDANLCEIISVSPENESESKEFINKLLEKNRFDVRYREQLEKTSATGTVGAYIYLKNAKYLKNSDGSLRAEGGEIRINYCDAELIIPLTIENGLVTECAFSSSNTIKGKKQTTLVIFTLEDGSYKADTIIFDAKGKEKPDKKSSIQLGEVKPFAIMINAEVNNLDDMEGFGLPKVYYSIPLFKALDLCFNVLFSDLAKAEKIVLINELLCEMMRDEKGNLRMTPQQKEIFVLLGEKLPDAKTLIQEYNPEIRVEEITKTFELVLSLLSMQFGYGSKKYTFENGQIKTATEYIGTRQDAMQELNKQRKQAEDYITDIVHAALWFSNQFSGTAYNVEETLSIQFDDSYVEDKTTKLTEMRMDALSFPEIPILRLWYLMEKYNIPEEEAKKYIGEIRDETDELDLED